MGDSIEQWRATIGRWSGGSTLKCLTLQYHIAQSSNHPICYMQIRFLVLISLLVIGCVELNPGPNPGQNPGPNPGPNNVNSNPTQNPGGVDKYYKRPGTGGLHGELYELKTAEFLFARGLNTTEEFKLASNVNGTGAFDDLVFRYKLRNSGFWKTCFIQLKHKKTEGQIQRVSLTQMSGDFSLFKYFVSYCEIKANAATLPNLIQCGPFDDYEFVIYTKRKMESSSLQGGNSDPLSLLSSGTGYEYGKYVTFNETSDRDVFQFFEELSACEGFIKGLDSKLKSGTSVDDIILQIRNFQGTVTNNVKLEELIGLNTNQDKKYVNRLINEVTKCDFSLFKEYLSKVKIFHSQSNEKSFKVFIEEELQKACKAPLSVVDFIYGKFEEGFNMWWESGGLVFWLNESSDLWKAVEKLITDEIDKISEIKIQDINGYGIRFNQQHVQKLADAIEQNTVLNIVSNSSIRILQTLKTHQALNILRYRNSLFIDINSLINASTKIENLWPCKWTDILVADCDPDGHMAQKVLDILQESGKNNRAGKKVILISTKQMDSEFKKKIRDVRYFEDGYDIRDVDENSQKQILGKRVNFQGTNVPLLKLVGTDPPQSIKYLVDSDVISYLLSEEHKLSFGRDLCDYSKYYVTRVLQHHIYLKKDILKVADDAITFGVSGLQADEFKKYLPAGEQICEFVYDEREKKGGFYTVSCFSNTTLRAEFDNTETNNEARHLITPEEVRYVILGKKNPETEFNELKNNLCRNVHWIHVKEGCFLWRKTNGNIDIIRRYTDNTKCEEYDMKGLLKRNDRTMLLVAEPGMGKSTFLSYMAHEIKKLKPSVWVLRINLKEYTQVLEDFECEQGYIDKCKTFLWTAAHSAEEHALKVKKEVFFNALEETGNMLIILDGFDEISLYYSRPVERLVRVIIDKTESKIWISSRLHCRQYLEDIVGNFAFTLQPFTTENQIEFLENYWSEVTDISSRAFLPSFAKQLLNLCSKNFSDKDGEITGIPLQTMMLGESFVNEAKEYCCSREFNLTENFNLHSLFKKFTEKKFDIYFIEKNKMDISKPGVKSVKKDLLEIHMISALLYLFFQNEYNEQLGTNFSNKLEKTVSYLRDGEAQSFGIITKYSKNMELNFIHRCFAEYFAAKWFTENFRSCEELISNFLFKSKNQVTRNIFDRMLAENSEIHNSVINNDMHALRKPLWKETDINTIDKGGRTALHLAASYNRPYMQQLLLLPKINANIIDEVLKWTPLRYADRTRSWMAMDILLQKVAKPYDIVFTRNNAKYQKWGQAAVWECGSVGHIKLLEFMLDCGIDVNAIINVPENFNKNFTLLHRASYCGQFEVVTLIANRGADINIRDSNNNNALHLAAESGSVDIIKLLLDKEICVNLTNANESTPLHVSAQFGHLEVTKTLVGRGASLNNTNKCGHTPLMVAEYEGKLEIFRYLAELLIIN